MTRHRMTNNMETASPTEVRWRSAATGAVTEPFRSTSAAKDGQFISDGRPDQPRLAASGSGVAFADPEANIDGALGFTLAQGELLRKARCALDRMLVLTTCAQDEIGVRRAESDREFESLIGYLKNLATVESDGRCLFDGSTLAVNLDGGDNKLILSGVCLRAEILGWLADLNLESPSAASRANGSIRDRLARTAVAQTVIAANHAQLMFLTEQAEALKSGSLESRPAALTEEAEAKVG